MRESEVAQSCPTPRDPIDGSPPGSPVPGIFQARTLEWLAISFSNAWKWKVKVKLLSHVRLLATPWTAAYQAPLSISYQFYQIRWLGFPKILNRYTKLIVELLKSASVTNCGLWLIHSLSLCLNFLWKNGGKQCFPPGWLQGLNKPICTKGSE